MSYCWNYLSNNALYRKFSIHMSYYSKIFFILFRAHIQRFLRRIMSEIIKYKNKKYIHCDCKLPKGWEYDYNEFGYKIVKPSE